MIMGGGEFKSSSLLQQMMWSGGTDSKNMLSSLMPCAEAPAAPAAEDREAASSNDKMPPLSSPPSMLLLPHQHLLQISSEVNGGGAAATCSLAISSDLRDGRESNLPGSWSQLLLGGLVGDHEGYSAATALLSKGLEEGPTAHQGSAAAYSFYGHGHGHGGGDGGGGEEIQTSGTNNNKPQVSQMLSASSPRSCITSTSPGSNMLDFSNSTVQQAPEVKNHHSDNSSEGNSTASGSAPKKARVQTSSSAQSTLKETIGYIRFLLGQIEVLSFPYLGNDGSSSDNTTMQQHTVLASEHTILHAGGQDDEEGVGDEGKKKADLRSRGLCLVPVSCTSHLQAAGDDSGASDFWAVAAAAAPPPPPTLGGIIWR